MDLAEIDLILDAISAEVDRGWDWGHWPTRDELRVAIMAKLGKPCEMCAAAGFPECHGPHVLPLGVAQ